jgi:hypothetical protein
MRYLPRSRSVPTSLYDLSMMKSGVRPNTLHLTKLTLSLTCCGVIPSTCFLKRCWHCVDPGWSNRNDTAPITGETYSGHLAWNDQILEVLNRWRTNSWGALYFCRSFYSMHFSIVDWVCCISKHSTLIKRQVIPGVVGGLTQQKISMAGDWGMMGHVTARAWLHIRFTDSRPQTCSPCSAKCPRANFVSNRMDMSSSRHSNIFKLVATSMERKRFECQWRKGYPLRAQSKDNSNWSSPRFQTVRVQCWHLQHL